MTPEEAMWFVGGTGIQTEGEMEDQDRCLDNPELDELESTIIAVAILLALVLVAATVIF